MLATEHNVCKAYLSRLHQMGVQPAQIIMFHRKGVKSFRAGVRAAGSGIKSLARRGLKLFGPSQKAVDFLQLRELLEAYCVSHGLVNTDYSRSVPEMIGSHPAVRDVFAPHINSDCVVESIFDCPQKYVIFCGGGILRRNILSLPKRFIHVHPGVVPAVKGADGILWSSLVHKRVGMSAFFMNEGIDTGDIIQTKEYDIPRLFGDGSLPFSRSEIASFIVNEVDPVFRANLLGLLFLESLDPACWSCRPQNPSDGKVYYFMHDQLKELAVKRWGNGRKV